MRCAGCLCSLPCMAPSHECGLPMRIVLGATSHVMRPRPHGGPFVSAPNAERWDRGPKPGCEGRMTPQYNGATAMFRRRLGGGPRMRQEIRFCRTSDGVRIAYATTGSGPPLVKVSNWLSHLEFDWNSPVWRHEWTELSRDRTLIRYDVRGCGLSDWEVSDLSFDAWVRDLETVVDELELERFPLLGISQGGPIAIAYAARHPERVSRLILYGSYA